jgi:hypothetical protein
MMIDIVGRNDTKKSLIDSALFCWLAQAEPGDILEYHRGFLARDIIAHARRLSEHDRLELVRLARSVWWAGEQKLIHLVQRRRGASLFSYLAIARPRPNTASSSLSSPLLKDAWPNNICAAFEPARAVETGKRSYPPEKIKGGL